MKINGIPYRTIWPAEENQKVIRIIDQRHLPHRLIIEELTCVFDFVRAIRDMHVRGAGLIGATAAFGMYCAAAAEKAFPKMTAPMIRKRDPEREVEGWFRRIGRSADRSHGNSPKG